MAEASSSEPKPAGHSLAGILTAIGGVIAAVAALLTGLDALGVFDPRPTASPTLAATAAMVATPGPTGTPASARLLFADDFSNANGGWDEAVASEAETGIVAGEYRITVFTTETDAWANPRPQDLMDYVVEVDARRVEGPDDNAYGLLVRYQANDAGYYMFAVSSDGQCTVQVNKGGEFAELAPWAPSDAVRPGSESNRLRVSCQGDLFRFFVNGKQIAEVKDGSFKAGNVGLIASTYGEAGVVVAFDNFRVQALTP